MPNKLVRRKGQKGGFVPTKKTLREARERRLMIARIQEEERLDLERRLAVLREHTQDFPVARTLSSGHRPQFNSGSVIADHPRQQDQERPLTLEEMNIDLNLPTQRRHSIGGIKKKKSRRHKKQTKSRRKSKRNKKKRTSRHVNKKLKRKSYSRRR